MSDKAAKNKRRIFRLTVLLVLAVVLVAATVPAIRWAFSLRDPGTLQLFQEKIRSLGVGGWFLLFGIQYIQIVIAFIPGGPIQMVAGALFGPWGGMLTCLLGTFTATLSVFALVKRFGRRILYWFVDDADLDKYQFLQNSKRLEFLVLVLFFIPGTPKDALTYVFALTTLSVSRFIVISTLARIPAMLTSVLAGDSIADGKWLKALLLFAGISVISLGGFALHKKFIAPHMAKRSARNK